MVPQQMTAVPSNIQAPVLRCILFSFVNNNHPKKDKLDIKKEVNIHTETQIKKTKRKKTMNTKKKI